MNKNELLETIQQCRHELECCWEGATEEQLTQRPGPQSDWSVKDLMAHLTFWEQHLLKHIGNNALGMVSDSEVDAMNAQVYEANKDRPLAEVQAEFRRSLDEICDLVGCLSDDELNSSGKVLPNQMTLWQYIAEETYEHYRDDHLPDVRAWARREGVLM